MTSNKDVYIVDGNRTPFLKARGKPGKFSASDLGVLAARELFTRLPVEPNQVDAVVTGCVMPSENEANISRVISLRLGCGKEVPAYSVQRNCASGMQAIDSASKDILLGRRDMVLAGGTEAMSRAPLIYNKGAVNWFADMMKAKTVGQKLKMFTKLRPSFFFAPIVSLLKGLTDPIVGLNMGQTAENVAYDFSVSREDMDKFALNSHQKTAKATDEGHFKTIMTPVIDSEGGVHESDDGMRRDSSMEKLAKLKPFFDKKFGKVTAANSSQVTDGSAFLLLASKEAVDKYNLPVIARIIDTEWVGVDPKVMGIGPAHAVPPLLKRQNKSFDDIDFWEINEAFAGQVLGCVKAWEDEKYCKDELGLDGAFGKLDLDKLNVDGGAVAIGHPVGASGARIVLHLANTLKREKAKYGVATICIGGGQAGAMLIENV